VKRISSLRLRSGHDWVSRISLGKPRRHGGAKTRRHREKRESGYQESRRWASGDQEIRRWSLAALDVATDGREKKKFEIGSTKSETNPKFKCSNGQNEKEPRIFADCTDSGR